jgi:sugar/nucleoside kinase (ribokinase family)
MKNIDDYILHELNSNVSPRPVVTIVADLNYDYIYNCPHLESGREVMISDFDRYLAGAGGYVACGLAKLGADVYLLTELGKDEEGESLYSDIVAFGVKRDGIKLVKNKKSPFTLIFTEEEEQKPRQVATFPGTSKNFSIDAVDYKKFTAMSDLVYSCNYFILQRLREEIRFVFKYAGSRNVLTAYDANAGDGWDDEKALDTLKNRIYPLTDIVFLNESEACYLTKVADPVKSIRDINPRAVTVVIKLGARGVLIRHRNRLYSVDAFGLKEKVRDTIGAGDSFQAAFIYFYLRKFPIELCGILSAANAASTVMFKGGTGGQCTVQELVKFIKYYRIFDAGGGNIKVQHRSSL